MLLTDYFTELEGKIPYINYFDDLFCRFEEREQTKCTEEFYEKGFFTETGWDSGKEYQYKCHACPYFRHNIGFYFGNGRYTKDFDEKDTFYINAKNPKELSEVIRHMPNAKKVYLIHGKNFDLSSIEDLRNIESIQLGLGSKDVLWDMSKTTHLRTLEFWFGISPPSLDMLSRAGSVEYLNLQVLTSQTGLTILPSFDFFAGMKGLKGLILSGVTHTGRNTDALIALPALERLWCSPNLFLTEEYAKFEARKFKIYREYGIFENDDFICPLGIGKRAFRSEKSKEKFMFEYRSLMNKYA